METKSWAALTLLITLLATALHLAGFIEPLWIFLDADNFHVAIGLWFSEGCGIEGTCIGTTPSLDFGITADDTYHKSDFKWVQALETIGTIGALLLLILLAIYVYGYGEWRRLRRIYLGALFSAVVAAFFILLGVIVFCATFWKVVGTSNLVSSTSFPWAMLQCFFAGIIYVIVSLLIWLKCWSTGFVKTALPMSGESQVDLYPMTQRDTFRRFFNPPYHQTRRANSAIVFRNYDVSPPGIYEGYMSDDGFDRHRVAAIDNMAFSDRFALERGLPYHHSVRPQTVLVSSPEPPPPQYVHTVVREKIPTRTAIPEGPVVERVLTRQHSAPAQTVVLTRPAPPEHHHTVVRDTIPPHAVVYDDFDGRDGHVVERVVSREHQARPPPVVVSRPDPPRAEQHHHTVVRETIPAHNVVYEYDTESRAPYEETQPVRVIQRTVVPEASDDAYYNDRNINRFRPVDPDPVVYRESPLADRDDLRGTTIRETRYYADNAYPRRSVNAGNEMRTGVEEQYVTRPIYTASKPYTPSTRRYIVTENGVEGRQTPTVDYLPAEYNRYDQAPFDSNLNGGSALRYTTHLNPLSRPTTFVGTHAGLGDSTYIYRPTQLQYY